MIAQVIYLSLILMSLGYDIAVHGKQKEGKHDVVLSIVAYSIAVLLLY